MKQRGDQYTSSNKGKSVDVREETAFKEEHNEDKLVWKKIKYITIWGYFPSKEVKDE